MVQRRGQRVKPRQQPGLGRAQIEARVTELAGRVVPALGVELVDVEFVREHGQVILRIYIDKEGGISLEDCERVSRALDAPLDEADLIATAYSLEVSSPGIERPLKTERDYARFAGHLVQVRTFGPIEGRRNWKGHLIGLDGEDVVLDLGETQVRFPLSQVAKAHLVFE